MYTSRALAIRDPEVEKFIATLSLIPSLYYTNHAPTPSAELWKEWSGIDHPGYRALISDGVTGAYNDFYTHYPLLETVTFHGEYPYHRSIGAKRIDRTEELKKGMKLIISDPFAAHGCRHELLDDILDKCDSVGVPVFIDRAFAQCSLTDFEARDCVKYIAYSFSKAFYTGKCRTGIVFKTGKNTQVDMLNEYGYINEISLYMNTMLMHRFNYNYIHNKYLPKQRELCKSLDITPSDTVFLGYTDSLDYKDYSREGYINRICLSDAFRKN